MTTKLEKKIIHLQMYCTAMTLILGTVLVLGWSAQKKEKFAEIDAERINIVDKDGKLRMVISNAERQHPGIVDGKLLKRETGRPAGMIFFNEKGDEVGGLTFTGDNDKGQYNSFTFDKFRGDQTIAFQHLENKNGDYFAGISFNDENMTTTARNEKMETINKIADETAKRAALKELRENGGFLVNRLAIGRGRDKSALLIMSDAKGRARISMKVVDDGSPKLDFLDESGKVMFSLPDHALNKK